MSIADKLVTIAENEQKVYNAGYEAGKKSESDRFADSFQNYGNRTNYWGAFCCWADDIFNLLKYPLTMVEHGYAFRDSTITTIKEISIINTSQAVQLFYDAKYLRYVGKLTFARTMTAFSNTFKGCYALEHIIIDGVIAGSVSFADCPLLDAESISSIISSLVTLAETNKLTITFNSAVKAKLTAEQIDTITNVKHWELG